MLLTIVKPFVRPEFTGYLVESTSVSIHIGLVIPKVNLIDPVEQQEYTLLDAHGTVLQVGTIDVELGSFNSVLTFEGLDRDTFYVLQIGKNMSGHVRNAVLVTGHIQETVDETSVFPEIADITTTGTLKVISNTREMTKSVLFKDVLDFGDLGDRLSNGVYIGHSIVKVDHKLYAYRPSMLHTKDRTIQRTIRYVPFVGLPVCEIPVVQMADLTEVGHLLYRVDPPVRLRVKLGNAVIIQYTEPVAFLDLTNIVIPRGTCLAVEQI